MLGIGERQMIEIAAGLARGGCLLLLDEPTAALSSVESERLFGWLRELRQRGAGIVYVSHRLDEVRELCDRVSVMRDGTLVQTAPAAALSAEDMITLMSGVAAQAAVPFRSQRTNRPILTVKHLSCGRVREASFSVFEGERLGIAGLVGSGRTELLRAIFGADRATDGSVLVTGMQRPQRFDHPRRAVAAGVAMLTEDRKRDGLLLTQPIRANMSISTLRSKFSRFGRILASAEKASTTALHRRLEVRSESIEQLAQSLSGGNQQKVLIAKWLLSDARVLLFDEPSRGIDVPARRRIHQELESLAQRRKGIVIVSSDLDELLENCDRIVVMSAGRLVATFERGLGSREQILQASFSGYRSASD
jgi:ribose transport system ATP-binding protein